jgi:hypothetical protein
MARASRPTCGNVPEVRQDACLHDLTEKHHHGPNPASQGVQKVLVAFQKLRDAHGWGKAIAVLRKRTVMTLEQKSAKQEGLQHILHCRAGLMKACGASVPAPTMESFAYPACTLACI